MATAAAPRHRDVRGRRDRACDAARGRQAAGARSAQSSRRPAHVVRARCAVGPRGRGRTSSAYALSTARATRSARTPRVTVRVRYVELRRDRIEVAMGRRFSVRVFTDARSYRGSSRGSAAVRRRRVLVLRAPTLRGRTPLRHGRRCRGTSRRRGECPRLAGSEGFSVRGECGGVAPATSPAREDPVSGYTRYEMWNARPRNTMRKIEAANPAGPNHELFAPVLTHEERRHG